MFYRIAVKFCKMIEMYRFCHTRGGAKEEKVKKIEKSYPGVDIAKSPQYDNGHLLNRVLSEVCVRLVILLECKQKYV